MSTDQAGIEPDPTDGDALEDGVLYEEQVQPEYGILGFTLRELLIVVVWALAFTASFFPVGPGAGPVWAHGLAWILSIGVPTVAAFLLVLRRFSPDGIRRVGSLGIDQFASVAFSVAAVVWAQTLWNAIAATVAVGEYLVGWVTVFETAAFLGLVALTVAAPLIPRLREDFHGRLETLAHRNANPVRPVISRPRDERTIAGAASSAPSEEDAEQTRSEPETAGSGSRDWTDTDEPHAVSDSRSAEETAFDPDQTSVIEAVPQRPATPDADQTAVIDTTPDESSDSDEPRGEVIDPNQDADQTLSSDGHATTAELREMFALDPDVTESDDGVDVTAEPGPFWILAGSERDVHDEHGRPLFRIGPQAWALVIEDRGGAYVVRHDDGRIGYLHDISNITKG